MYSRGSLRCLKRRKGSPDDAEVLIRVNTKALDSIAWKAFVTLKGLLVDGQSTS